MHFAVLRHAFHVRASLDVHAKGRQDRVSGLQPFEERRRDGEVEVLPLAGDGVEGDGQYEGND
jgi:hypothetical protein